MKRLSRRLEDQEVFCDMLADLIEEQADWSQATFGTDSERGPMGALKHLEREAVEAQRALDIGPTETIEELADCFLLLLDGLRRAGFGFKELVEESQSKMLTNMARKWPKPTSDEPVEHVRD